MEVFWWKENNNWNGRHVGWPGYPGIFTQFNDSRANKLDNYDRSRDWRGRYFSQRHEVGNNSKMGTEHRNKTEREMNVKTLFKLNISLNKLCKIFKRRKQK